MTAIALAELLSRRRSCERIAEALVLWRGQLTSFNAHAPALRRRSAARAEAVSATLAEGREPEVIGRAAGSTLPGRALGRRALRSSAGAGRETGDEEVKRPLLRSIAGIAAALRNTG
jgi:hypothetical protein